MTSSPSPDPESGSSIPNSLSTVSACCSSAIETRGTISAGEQALAELGGRSFDLAYSNLVFQHVSDRAAVREYIAELVRVLAPGGLLAFQLLTHVPLVRRLQPRRRIYGALRRAGASPGFLYRRLRVDPVGMYAIDRDEVRATLERAGAKIIRVDESAWPGGIRSATWFATR